MKFISETLIRAVVLSVVVWFGYKLYIAVLDPLEVLIIEPPPGTLIDNIATIKKTYSMAIEQVSQEGIMWVQPIEANFINLGSEKAEFGSILEQELQENDYDAIFGCFSSICLAEVADVAESHDTLLFYPLPHHGYTSHENIVFMGPVPNQVVLPALHWALKNLGDRVYIVGSNELYSRVIGDMVERELEFHGATFAGATYYGVDQVEMPALPPELNQDQVDFVVNLIVGDTSLSFMEHYGILLHGAKKRPPNLLLTFNERELRDTSVSSAAAGSYFASDYTWSNRTPENKRFKEKWQEQFGDEYIASSTEVAVFSSVMLWAEAVDQAPSPDLDHVSKELSGLTVETAARLTSMDWKPHHSLHSSYVSLVSEQGETIPIWQSEGAVIPAPENVSMSGHEFVNYLKNLNLTWDGNWYSSETVVKTPEQVAGKIDEY